MTIAPKIILAAGGTGGHMMPAEAVADILTAQGYAVSLVTDARGDAIDNVMPNTERMVLATSSHMGGGLFGKITFGISLIRSFLTVRSHFGKNKPAAVVGFGGYPSLPAVLAARSMSIPYILHEQNAVLGRVNRSMAKGALVVALTFEKTSMIPAGVKTTVTGNPVRKMIMKCANIAYAIPLGFGSIRLFVIGGSQGARILSDIIPAALAGLSDEYKGRLDIVHQARPEDVGRVKAVYEQSGIKAVVEPYFKDVGSLLLRTQLVISRAGASTLAELMAMGRPAILVPLAIAADNHQFANARIMVEAEAAILMKESEFTVPALQKQLETLLDNMAMLSGMSDGMRSVARLQAGEDLAALIVDACSGEGTA